MYANLAYNLQIPNSIVLHKLSFNIVQAEMKQFVNAMFCN
jgi:hypothetical protein